MFGFPGETHQDFLDSIEAGKYFDCANFIVFSERPNTKAAKMKNKVSKNIKIELIVYYYRLNTFTIEGLVKAIL